jgi:hypothetical protein
MSKHYLRIKELSNLTLISDSKKQAAFRIRLTSFFFRLVLSFRSYAGFPKDLFSPGGRTQTRVF